MARLSHSDLSAVVCFCQRKATAARLCDGALCIFDEFSLERASEDFRQAGEHLDVSRPH